MIVIRYAGPHEVEEIASLWERIVKELKPDYAPNVSWWIGMAKALLNTEAYHLLTAVDDCTGRIVGFLDGFLYPEPSTGKLHAVGQHFYVLPEYRKTSVSARLYREAIRVARAAEASVLEFFCFPEEQPFWASKGYTATRMMMRRPGGGLCLTP